MGISDGFNTYHYVNGKPILLIDPSGNQGVLEDLLQQEQSLQIFLIKAKTQAEREIILTELEGIRGELATELDLIKAANDVSVPYTDKNEDPTQHGVNPEPSEIETDGPPGVLGSIAEGVGNALFEGAANIIEAASNFDPIANAKQTFEDPVGNITERNIAKVFYEGAKEYKTNVEEYDRAANELQTAIQSGDQVAVRDAAVSLGEKAVPALSKSFSAGGKFGSAKPKALPKARKAKDYRNRPGTARGVKDLPEVKGKWLRGGTAKIPKRIGERLSGRRFKSFSNFKYHFWREVYKDIDLRKQFTPKDVSRLKKGQAPLAPEAQQLGNKKGYELHHIGNIKDTGRVYDLSNIQITTPLYHIGQH
jgi:hypothetical protein